MLALCGTNKAAPSRATGTVRTPKLTRSLLKSYFQSCLNLVPGLAQNTQPIATAQFLDQFFTEFAPAQRVVSFSDEVYNEWEKLAEGGQHIECGWLTDKFGVSWQIVPRILPELLGGGAEQTERVMRAVMSMKKLDLAQMKAAASAQ